MDNTTSVVLLSQPVPFFCARHREQVKIPHQADLRRARVNHILSSVLQSRIGAVTTEWRKFPPLESSKASFPLMTVARRRAKLLVTTLTIRTVGQMRME